MIYVESQNVTNFDPIAYTYNAAIHCAHCAHVAYPNIDDPSFELPSLEQPGAIFSWDSRECCEHCDTCQEPIAGSCECDPARRCPACNSTPIVDDQQCRACGARLEE